MIKSGQSQHELFYPEGIVAVEQERVRDVPCRPGDAILIAGLKYLRTTS